VSWARDGSGVYYSRYPALPNGKGDDAARPAVYFHKLGDPQESDRLVYAVTDHPTRAPSARVTEDGHYLVITLFDGYDRNGVSLLDLRQPGAKVTPLFYAWDALYSFIGSSGDNLYFHTTKDAPLRRVIEVDARRPAASACAHRRARGLRGPRRGRLTSVAELLRSMFTTLTPSPGYSKSTGRWSGRCRSRALEPSKGSLVREGDGDVLLLHGLPDPATGLPLRRDGQQILSLA